MPSFDATEPYADRFAAPLADSRSRRTATLSWTDSLGPHEVTIAAPLTLGSAPTCDVVITDPSVSRVHAELRPTDEGIEIRDLSSRNGTYCDALRIREVIARDEVRLRLGPIELKLHRPEESTDVDLWPRSHFGPLVGRSAVMRGLFQQLSRLAPSDATVMIKGDTGTGKELVARAIHEFSNRRAGAYMVIDCSTLHPDLAESELFGHARGSFSGAVQNTAGAFEAADGGTLFLDEIGELPLKVQAKFLRALEARAIRRVGETNWRPVNVRVISASHRDLREMVNERTFREDLYFRLAVIPVRVPKLRERAEDIPMLVEHFVETHRGLQMPSAEVMKRLVAEPWTGNVRALRNAVDRASALGWDATVAADPDADGDDATDVRPSAVEPVDGASAADRPTLRESFYEARKRGEERAEREYLTLLMSRYPGDIYGAAIRAVMHHTYLRKKLKEYGM